MPRPLQELCSVRWLAPLALAALAGCSSKVPPAPRVRFDPQAVQQYEATEHRKAAAFSPNEEEQAFLEAFERFQADEGAGYPAQVEEDVRFREKQVSDALFRLATTEGKERVFALGDFLADRCATTIMSSSDPETDAKACGSLLFHATESGLIDSRGSVKGPPHLLRVLFKIRWRSLVPDLDPLAGLSPLELLAYHDFMVVFGAPTKPEKKLASITELQKLDPSYPVADAKAYVQALLKR